MFNYPYGDTQQLNLDWFLQEFKNLVAAWEAEKAGIDGALDEEIAKAEAALADVFAARDAAAASASAASTSASNASTSATAASNAATAAGNSATLANNKAAAAGLSEANAAQSASNASTSATAASNAATAAGNSATAAGNSATAAGNSATAAGNSATAAGNSASAASQSASDAAASAAQAAASAANATAPYYLTDSQLEKFPVSGSIAYGTRTLLIDNHNKLTLNGSEATGGLNLFFIKSLRSAAGSISTYLANPNAQDMVPISGLDNSLALAQYAIYTRKWSTVQIYRRMVIIYAKMVDGVLTGISNQTIALPTSDLQRAFLYTNLDVPSDAEYYALALQVNAIDPADTGTKIIFNFIPAISGALGMSSIRPIDGLTITDIDTAEDA